MRSTREINLYDEIRRQERNNNEIAKPLMKLYYYLYIVVPADKPRIDKIVSILLNKYNFVVI